MPLALITGAMLMLASCQSAQPKLNPEILPQGYKRPLSSDTKPAFAWINQDKEAIKAAMHSVLQPSFQKQIEALHPINGRLSAREYEINRLAIFSLLKIYYLWGPIPNEKQGASKLLGCNPLSNQELQFMLHLYSSQPFRKKTTDLLFLTAEELMLQQGYKPKYYPVTSKYLAAKFKRRTPTSLRERNLFASSKKIGKVNKAAPQTNQENGFIYCRKEIK